MHACRVPTCMCREVYKVVPNSSIIPHSPLHGSGPVAWRASVYVEYVYTVHPDVAQIII